MRILAIDPGSKLGWATNATGRLEWGTEDFRIRNGESSGNRWRRFGEWLADASRGETAPPFPDLPRGLVEAVQCTGSIFKAKAEGEIPINGYITWGANGFVQAKPPRFTGETGRFPVWVLGVAREAASAGDYFAATANIMLFGENLPSVDLIVYERSHFMPKARAAAEIAAGFTTRLEEHCERHSIALQPVAVQTLKAFALPAPKRPKRKKGDPPAPRHDTSKEAMIAAAAKRLETATPLVSPTSSSAVATVVNGLTEHEADALWLYWWSLENCGKEAVAR